MPSHERHRSDRLPHLDGLRGYAALIVVIHHFVAGFWPAAFFRGGGKLPGIFSETPLLVLIDGPFAVFVFFVLSGFVLSGGRALPVWSLPRQILGRLVRLGIPSGASVVVSLVILKCGGSFNIPAGHLTSNPWLVERYPAADYPLGQALLDLAGRYFLTGNAPLNSILWTMRMELIGSLLVFLVSTLDADKRVRTHGFALLVALGLSWRQSALYVVPFIGGALIRETALHRTRAAATDGRWWLVLLGGLILGGAPYSDATGTLYQPLAALVGLVQPFPLDTLRIAGAILLLLAVVKLQPAVLATRFSQWLGRISFSLYLTHLLVLASLASGMFLLLGGRYLLAQGVSFVAVSLGAAAVFHRAIENPAMKLSRRIRGVRLAAEHRLRPGAALR